MKRRLRKNERCAYHRWIWASERVDGMNLCKECADIYHQSKVRKQKKEQLCHAGKKTMDLRAVVQADTLESMPLNSQTT
jgi:hypothetical protein